LITAASRLRVEVGLGVCPLPGENACGDACETFAWSRGVLVAIADGLGHGPQAAAAAHIFMTVARECAESPLDELFARAHRALLKSRGVVAAVARFDEASRELTLAGLGNIGAVFARAEPRSVERPVLVPGVLGSSYRQVRPQPLRFGAGDLLMLHTDGVRARLEAESWRGLSAQSAVDCVLRTHTRRSDDAGCIVARCVLDARSLQPGPTPDQGESSRAREIPVADRSDADCAAQEARRFAEAVGLCARAQWEVSIATSELATNIAKHAGRGVIRLDYEPGPLAALVLEARDSGRGIADVEAALRDGYSQGGLRSERPYTPGQGLGVGLGSVRRLMDRVDVESDDERGTRIVARKRVNPAP
jgi:negative regulator of sigma-B (phosphoserine phosphatase)